MSKKVLIVLVLALLPVMLFAGGQKAASAGAQPTDIAIGSVWSVTGVAAPLGQAQQKGSELAVELANDGGGIMGHKIVYQNIDGQSDTAIISSAAKRLAEERQVVAAIGGEDDSLTSAMGPVFQDAGVPFVIGSATTPTQPRMGSYVFMTAFGDNQQGQAAAQYMADKLGWKKIAVMWDNASAYSTLLSEYIVSSFKKATGDAQAVPFQEVYQTGDTQFTAQLTRIKNARVKIDGLVVTPPFPQDGPIIAKQAKALGLDVQFFFTDGADDKTLTEVGGSAVEGATISTQFASERPLTEMGDRFVEAYRQKYGEMPGAFEDIGFDNMQIIIEAITVIMEKEGADGWDAMSLAERRTAIRDTIQSHKFVTTTVPISYPDPATAEFPRVPLKPVYFKTVKNGQRVYLDHFMPEQFM
jgi:branched-chain amino acid transport system substrate-binding protein